jgi:hypothetical protein
VFGLVYLLDHLSISVFNLRIIKFIHHKLVSLFKLILINKLIFKFGSVFNTMCDLNVEFIVILTEMCLRIFNEGPYDTRNLMLFYVFVIILVCLDIDFSFRVDMEWLTYVLGFLILVLILLKSFQHSLSALNLLGLDFNLLSFVIFQDLFVNIQIVTGLLAFKF